MDVKVRTTFAPSLLKTDDEIVANGAQESLKTLPSLPAVCEVMIADQSSLDLSKRPSQFVGVRTSKFHHNDRLNSQIIPDDGIQYSSIVNGNTIRRQLCSFGKPVPVRGSVTRSHLHPTNTNIGKVYPHLESLTLHITKTRWFDIF